MAEDAVGVTSREGERSRWWVQPAAKKFSSPPPPLGNERATPAAATAAAADTTAVLWPKTPPPPPSEAQFRVCKSGRRREKEGAETFAARSFFWELGGGGAPREGRFDEYIMGTLSIM